MEQVLSRAVASAAVEDLGWRLVLGTLRASVPVASLAEAAVVAVWFQSMAEPRPQRNRIHFDISVPHDEAAGRIAAALAAGGRLVSADRAPAFWILADPEGNEACVTTWQGRD